MLYVYHFAHSTLYQINAHDDTLQDKDNNVIFLFIYTFSLSTCEENHQLNDNSRHDIKDEYQNIEIMYMCISHFMTI